LNQLFIDILFEKYNNLLIIETEKNSAFIKFPAKSSDFGNVCICEEEVGSYIVEVGKFTHGHFDLYDGTEEERIVEAANDIVDFLEKLFSDQIICYGSHQHGGGWHLIQNDEEENIDWTDSFVWSGLYKRSKPIR
jgi:hypothetical protein